MKLSILPVLILGYLLAGCAFAPLKPGHSSVESGTLKAGLVQSQNPAQPSEQTTEETVTAGSTNGPVISQRRTTTRIGAAQKDTARDIAAKLASLRGIVWLGVLVFLFGAASFVYPPLKLIVGASVTTSAVIAGAGLALIFLPTIIVGHEALIMGGAGAVAIAYWFAHRHGRLQGLVDANKNGIDDREEVANVPSK